jgi:hypothetical protein
MVVSPSCRICGAESAKYKFRCCSGFFCSPDCFRSHTNCDPSDAKTKQAYEPNNVRTGNFDLNLGEDDILTDEELKKIRCDQDINHMLTASRLRAIVSRINHSKDRRRSFRRFYESDNQFSSLVNRIDALMGSSSA